MYIHHINNTSPVVAVSFTDGLTLTAQECLSGKRHFHQAEIHKRNRGVFMFKIHLMELGNLTESNYEDLYFWENGREGQKLLWGDPELQKCWSGNWPVWWWRSEPALRGRVWSPRWVTRSRSLHHWSPHPCCLPGKIGNPRGGLPLRAPRLRPLITHTPTSLRHCPPVCPFTGSVFLAPSWSFFEI